MKVRDWRSPEHGFATNDDEHAAPSFTTDDPWYPLTDEVTAQRVLHDPDSFGEEWAAEDEWERRNDALLDELWARLRAGAHSG